MTLTYLAVPYTHHDSRVMQQRFEAVNRYAAELMRDGVYVFSPISHSHPIALAGALPRGFDYWQGYNRTMLAKCSKLIVLMLGGWQESYGVQAEIALAEELGLEVEYQEATS